jgi:hypothetical protein
MRPRTLLLVLVLASVSAATYARHRNKLVGTCMHEAEVCLTCTDCSHCHYCAVEHGECSVCSGKRR